MSTTNRQPVNAGPAPHPATTPQRPPGLWAQRWGSLSVVATILAAAAFVLRFNPTDHVTDPTGPCLWHALFGINGPTCGGTRMFWYLLHGRLVQAARHHLLALLGAPVALYALLRWSLHAWLRITLPPVRLSTRVYVGYGIVWLLYAVVLRNLPWAPLHWFDINQVTP